MEHEETLKTEHFDCDCHLDAHSLRVTYSGNEESDDFPAFYSMHVQMREYLSWYKRVWEALKYVFTGRHGGWDHTMFTVDSEEFERFQEFFSQHED